MARNNLNQDFIDYILHLADNALILGHRNSEWCGHGPILEQDIALTNISLDLIGQARNFYQYAATLINQNHDVKNNPVNEDSLAYLRDNREFRNCLLVEQSNGDWAKTILRQFLFSSYQYYLYEQLQTSSDEMIVAIAEKSLKEVSYHVRWSGEWVVRFGDGTADSQQRMQTAIDELWTYTGELFEPCSYEKRLLIDKPWINPALIKPAWQKKVKEILDEATLSLPAISFMQMGGKDGQHTELLGYILADLQFLQRAYPGNEW